MRNGRCDMSLASWARIISPWATCRSFSTCWITAWMCSRRSSSPRLLLRGRADGCRARDRCGHDCGPEAARPSTSHHAVALPGGRASHPNRLGPWRADCGFRAAQGRLRARLLSRSQPRSVLPAPGDGAVRRSDGCFWLGSASLARLCDPWSLVAMSCARNGVCRKLWLVRARSVRGPVGVTRARLSSARSTRCSISRGISPCVFWRNSWSR